MSFGCEAISEIAPQAMAVTYWLEAPVSGPPYTTTVRFRGRRSEANGKLQADDTFSASETVEVLPGSGPVALTAHVEGLRPGEWEVSAEEERLEAGQRRAAAQRGRARPRRPRASASGPTTYGPVASILAPGARLGAWPFFVGLGWLAALGLQALVASHLAIGAGRVFAVSLVASVVGLAGAKAYYGVGHFAQGERRARQLLGGSCIQGFVLALAAGLVVGGEVIHLGLGLLFDTAAPALMLGMAIGRYGCFFGGCCVGRPTAGWGLWSSNRRIGVRRVPVQLYESALAFALGVVAFSVLWSTRPHPAGALFIGIVAAYTFGRQLLLSLRDQPRHTTHGQRLVLAACAAAIAGDVAVALLVG